MRRGELYYIRYTHISVTVPAVDQRLESVNQQDIYICRGRNCDPVGSPILPVETAIAVPTGRNHDRSSYQDYAGRNCDRSSYR